MTGSVLETFSEADQKELKYEIEYLRESAESGFYFEVSSDSAARILRYITALAEKAGEPLP